MLQQAAQARQAAGLGRHLHARAPGAGGIADLASNDYLGLSGDERLAEAAAAAARRWGAGSTGSRLVTGTTELHTQLEHELAAFSGAAGRARLLLGIPGQPRGHPGPRAGPRHRPRRDGRPHRFRRRATTPR